MLFFVSQQKATCSTSNQMLLVLQVPLLLTDLLLLLHLWAGTEQLLQVLLIPIILLLAIIYY